MISEGLKRPMLCYLDGGLEGYTTNSDVYSSQIDKVKCCAIIIKSSFDHMITSMLINFFRLKIPYKVFDNELKALAWLRTYL